MKARRSLIALALLAVYLLMTAGKCVRCVVTDLPPALAACPEPADMQALRPVAAERRTPFVTDPALPAVGFRAPPARG